MVLPVELCPLASDGCRAAAEAAVWTGGLAEKNRGSGEPGERADPQGPKRSAVRWSSAALSGTRTSLTSAAQLNESFFTFIWNGVHSFTTLL